jgi:hypothetical protein
VRTQPDQLGPVPDKLTQLPGGRGRDPCLGQAAHPQQVGQVRSIANIVLDPAVLKGLTIAILSDTDTVRQLAASDAELARGEGETEQSLADAMRRRGDSA